MLTLQVYSQKTVSLCLISLHNRLRRDSLKSGLSGEPSVYDSYRPAFLSQHRLLNSVGQPCIPARVPQNSFSEIPVSEEVNKPTDSIGLKEKLCSCKEKVANTTVVLSTPQYMQL